MYCTASGGGTLSYQWRRGTNNLSNGDYYSGVTTSVLTISNADSSCEGNDYNCVVTGTCGSVTTNNASVYLYTATAFDTPSNAASRSPGGASIQ